VQFTPLITARIHPAELT